MTTFCHRDIYDHIEETKDSWCLHVLNDFSVAVNLIAVNLKAVKFIGWNIRNILMWHANKSNRYSQQ
jgi:hypothetical protein